VSKKYLFFIIFFIVGGVSAFSVDIDLAKENYLPGETLQAEIFIEGTLEEQISASDIKLLCRGSSVSISPSLIKLKINHYYSFFGINQYLNFQECEFIIEDMIYYDGGFIKQNNFYKNFSLSESNESVVFVNPAGFKIDDISSQSNLRVYLENLGEEGANISINTESSFIEFSSNELSWLPESSGYFDIYLSEFSYADEEKTEVILRYGSSEFIIPIWIDQDVGQNTSNVVENITYVNEAKLEFVMEVERFNISLSEEEDLSGYITIKNVGTDLGEIDYNLTGNLFEIIDLQTETLNSLNAGDSFKEYLYVNQMKNATEGIYQGTFKVNYESKTIEFPIFVEIKGEEIVLNGTGNGGEDVGPGTPPQENEKINIWWFVFIVLLIILIILYFLYRKKTRKDPDFLPPRV
jgi:hypothetical protein